MINTLAQKPDLRPENRPYKSYGAAQQVLYCRDREVVLSGPAGTGKSRACLEKMHLIALKYPGMRGLIIRKTRESLTEAALVTYETKVLPENSPIAQNMQRRVRQAYQYPNGSTLVVGGIDKPGKIMSTEYDVIYVQEAIELTETDWESLLTRLRNGVMPYQQIIADTNPDTPQHWILQRRNRGELTMLDSRHEDNPTVTETYIHTLDSLTGPRKERLRYGRWVQAEGAIYEDWDRRKHLIDRFDIPYQWPRYWAVDFGYTNPFCWQAWAQDDDGRLYRYREIYMTGRIVKDHAAQIKQLTAGEPIPEAIICDHDAEDRATLTEALGMPTRAAFKAVSVGIQAVQARLRVAGDNKPRLFLLRDSLVERDSRLEEKKEPCCAEEEIDGYVWDLKLGRNNKEQPVKKYDHAMDAMRYLVAYVDTVGRGADLGDLAAFLSEFTGN